MKLLEIYLSPIDKQQFHGITSQSPVGDGSADSTLPFWDGQLDRRITLIKTLELSRGYQSAAFSDPDEQDWMIRAGLLAEDRQSFDPYYLETIGQAIYNSLLPMGSDLRSTFEAALRLCEQVGEDLHLRLKFAADSARRSRLADYPWELLHDGQRFLLRRSVVLSRYIAYEAVPPSLKGEKQLRVLLVSSSASDSQQNLRPLQLSDREAIQTGIANAQASKTIKLGQLSQVTRRGLSAYLTDCPENQRPHVVHFDGHGLYGKRCSNPECRQIHAGIKIKRCNRCNQQLPEAEGFLLFEHEHNAFDYVSAQEFADVLPPGIALVVLSACQSGMTVSGESVFNGAAQQLIDARVPSVVAMQYMVRVDAASQFTEQFYRVLSKREPLVVALREGRKWMMEQMNQWYRPVLYLRWADNDGGQLLTPVTLPEKESSLFIEATTKSNQKIAVGEDKGEEITVNSYNSLTWNSKIIEYSELESSLKDRDWSKADTITRLKMLEIRDSSCKGYLNSDDIKAFPKRDLQHINKLWHHYSSKRFGFSVQKEIYLMKGGKADGKYYKNAWNQFAISVEWKTGDDEWIHIDDLNFITSPRGHLPGSLFLARGVNNWQVEFSKMFLFLMTRPEI